MLKDIDIDFQSRNFEQLDAFRLQKQRNLEGFQNLLNLKSRLSNKIDKQSLNKYSEETQKLFKLEQTHDTLALLIKFMKILQSQSQIKALSQTIKDLVIAKDDIKPIIVHRLKEFQENETKKLELAIKIAQKYALYDKKQFDPQKSMTKDDSKILSDYIKIQSQLHKAYDTINEKYVGKVLKTVFENTCNAITYLFIDQSSQLHRVEEPKWMFAYISQTFQNIMTYVMKNLQLDQLAYQYCFNTLFNLLIRFKITQRFNKDVDALIKEQELLYMFIEGVLEVEQAITNKFSVQINEPCLFEELCQNPQILQKLLQFQENIFQKRIFRDFVYIDYSKINIKNLQVFNITQNFNIIFDKLYEKYIRCSSRITIRANTCYESILDSMVKRIKTAFDRIYNNNNEKYEILLIFRKIEDELRQGMLKYKNRIPKLQSILQILRHDIQQQFNNYAEHLLAPLNRKISKAILECPLEDDRFTSSEIDLNNLNQLHKQWKSANEKINQIYYYRDVALCRMLFMFLQRMQFSKDGLAAFLAGIEPFLRDLFTNEQSRLIRSLIFMEKSKLSEIIKDRDSIIRTFLTEQEIGIIQKLDYTA